MNFRWLRQTISIGDKMHSKCIGESRIVFRKEGCSLLSPHPSPPLLNNERILLQESKTPYISFKKINILWMDMAEHSVILLLKSQYYSRSFHLRFSGNSVSIFKKKSHWALAMTLTYLISAYSIVRKTWGCISTCRVVDISLASQQYM